MSDCPNQRLLPPGCEPSCRGCRYRHLSDPLSPKLEWLSRKLEAWQDKILPARSPDKVWGYRDRVRLTARWQEGWKLGLMQDNRLLAIPDCPIHSHRVNRVVAQVSRSLEGNFPLSFLVINGAQATLVTRQSAPPSDFSWAAKTGLEGLWHHHHPAAGRRMFHKLGWKLLWGQPRSRDCRGLSYGPTGFQQVQPRLHQQYLEEAAAFFQLGSQDQVVDLYCGAGHSLRMWVDAGARTTGVELAEEAVVSARRNVSQAVVWQGKGRHRLPQLKSWLSPGRYFLYLNPPRTGLEPEVLSWLLERPPLRLAYLSCSPGTLCRDLEQLESLFEVKALRPYDFFPQTHHVETQALLKLRL